jgi:NAD dependent epimerase/dehydratase family enzyme
VPQKLLESGFNFNFRSLKSALDDLLVGTAN